MRRSSPAPRTSSDARRDALAGARCGGGRRSSGGDGGGGVADLLAAAVDLVVVASPSGLHAEHARAALAAGRHVVLDKPPAADATQFGHCCRWPTGPGATSSCSTTGGGTASTALRTILDAGTLGTVHRFETSMDRWRPTGREGGGRSAAPADLGGLRYDLGPHLVDQALRLFGPVGSGCPRRCSPCGTWAASATTSLAVPAR